jgi:hypothetical protein
MLLAWQKHHSPANPIEMSAVLPQRSWAGNYRVSQFKLDGTFIRIFAGTGTRGSGDGEFIDPRGLTVLGSSGDEVAVDDCNNHRVQIFDREGNYTRQFGWLPSSSSIHLLG